MARLSQLRRAGASIPANIAEGRRRRTDDDFSRSLDDAMGAASKVEHPLLLPRDLGFLGMDAHDHPHAQTTQVKRMLASLLGRLRADA